MAECELHSLLRVAIDRIHTFCVCKLSTFGSCERCIHGSPPALQARQRVRSAWRQASARTRIVLSQVSPTLLFRQRMRQLFVSVAP